MLNPADLQLNEEITAQTWMKEERGEEIQWESDKHYFLVHRFLIRVTKLEGSTGGLHERHFLI